MRKGKPWLKDVIRVQNTKFERQDNPARLDKSERLTRFPADFFDRFIKSIKQEDILCYPETMNLIERLCKYHKVEDSNIFLVPGVDAAIKAFFEMAVAPGDEVIITNPCFPMYKVYPSLFNARAIEIPYLDRTKLDYDLLVESITPETALIALPNPNSPVGDYLDNEKIERLIKKSAQYSVPVLIDEVYYEYAPDTAIAFIRDYENVGIARTFSKAFGGAGIRTAYIIGSAVIIEQLSKWRLMYEINQIGVKFAVYALDHIEETAEYARQTKNERERIVRVLADADYEVISSYCNWFHMHGGKDNDEVVRVLKEHKVLFKTDSRIPHDSRNWIRLTIGPGLSETPYMKKIIERKF